MVKLRAIAATTGATATIATTLALVLLLAYVGVAQNRAPRPASITSPKQQFGHDVGDDYFLANYTQYAEYLQKLDRESERMTVMEIGKTAEGRPEYTAIITSPENHRRLSAFKDINRRLALAENHINVGGQKVYPAEVESVLQEMPEIAEVLVYGEKNAIVGEIVCAAVRLREPRDARDLQRDLRQFCRQRLQEFRSRFESS